MPTEDELKNGVPLFLRQLIDRLRLATTDSGAIEESAALHGGELLEMGFTVSQVVHGYGDVCQVITALAGEMDAPITAEEFHTFNRCLDDAIAHSVTEYERRRDASVMYNKHDGRVERGERVLRSQEKRPSPSACDPGQSDDDPGPVNRYEPLPRLTEGADREAVAAWCIRRAAAAELDVLVYSEEPARAARHQGRADAYKKMAAEFRGTDPDWACSVSRGGCGWSGLQSALPLARTCPGCGKTTALRGGEAGLDAPEGVVGDRPARDISAAPGGAT